MVPSSATQKLGLASYSYKLEKFREHLHSKGKTDADISVDPEYLWMKKEVEQSQPAYESPLQGSVESANVVSHLISEEAQLAKVSCSNISSSSSRGLQDVLVADEIPRDQLEIVTHKVVLYIQRVGLALHTSTSFIRNGSLL